MMNCKYCRANCTGAKHDREIALCLGYDPPKTNGDFIRSMSDEDLAEYLSYLEVSWRPAYAKKDEREWLDWLKKERE